MVYGSNHAQRKSIQQTRSSNTKESPGQVVRGLVFCSPASQILLYLFSVLQTSTQEILANNPSGLKRVVNNDARDPATTLWCYPCTLHQPITRHRPPLYGLFRAAGGLLRSVTARIRDRINWRVRIRADVLQLFV